MELILIVLGLVLAGVLGAIGFFMWLFGWRIRLPGIRGEFGGLTRTAVAMLVTAVIASAILWWHMESWPAWIKAVVVILVIVLVATAFNAHWRQRGYLLMPLTAVFLAMVWIFDLATEAGPSCPVEALDPADYIDGELPLTIPLEDCAVRFDVSEITKITIVATDPTGATAYGLTCWDADWVSPVRNGLESRLLPYRPGYEAWGIEVATFKVVRPTLKKDGSPPGSRIC